jgi:hypothetical protein
VFLNDHVAEVDADAKPNAPIVRHLRLAVDHPALNLSGAAHCVHNTWKFRQQAVAGVLYDAAPVLLDFRINHLPEMRFEALLRALLVNSHQARIADHISGEDRGETADRGHFLRG